MNTLIIILRIIHIFGGVFWVGVSLFNVGFLQPAVRATGAEGQAVMRYLTQKTRLLMTTYSAATLTLLAGLILYWIVSGFRLSFLTSGYGLTLTIGAIAGIIAWILAMFVVRGIFSQMQGIGQAIQAQGGPPTPQQMTEMQALGARLVKVGQIGVVFMVIALLGMSAARYVTF
jgi:uncharacterized membrane protein